MARSDPQFNLRMSSDLKARIEAEAAKNKRSATAEIIDRLERSLDVLPVNEMVDVSKLPQKALEEAAERAMELIIERRPDIFGDKSKRRK